MSAAFVAIFSVSAFAMTPNKTLNHSIAALEVSSGGKIGVSAINTADNMTFHYRGDERFPMGCTSKVMGVAAILKKSMQQPDLLQKRVNYTKADLTNWSPVTEKHLHDGMTIEALCAAAISYSDNTAMNLLVKELAGLKEINSFAHAIGNTTFRQDHGWPEEAMSGGEGNLNDSSTPKDMAESLEKLALGKVLGEAQRQLLVNWLQHNTTGNHRIRAGLPKGWVVGDKTGTGDYGTTNDIAILWPQGCAPIVLAVYYTHPDKDAVMQEPIIAAVTRLVINQLAQSDLCIKNDLGIESIV